MLLGRLPGWHGKSMHCVLLHSSLLHGEAERGCHLPGYLSHAFPVPPCLTVGPFGRRHVRAGPERRKRKTKPREPYLCSKSGPCK